MERNQKVFQDTDQRIPLKDCVQKMCDETGGFGSHHTFPAETDTAA